jgi:hypothetical protein
MAVFEIVDKSVGAIKAVDFSLKAILSVPCRHGIGPKFDGGKLAPSL